MDAYRRLVEWTRHFQGEALDVIRAYLGVGLFVRGVLLVQDSTLMLQHTAEPAFVSAALMHYVAVAHLVGGLLLAVGLFTRVAALVQVPILFGAVFFVHLHEGLLAAGQSLEFAALVLVLLLVLSVFGSGRWSADHYLFERPTGVPLDERIFGSFKLPDDVERDIPERSTRTSSSNTGATEARECACGRDLNHPRVTVEPRYGFLSGVRFLIGISAPVKEVVYWCEECGTVMQRSRDPDTLEKYRWHTS